MDIDFELYKVFYYVSKNLSFSKASRDLYISQSAVSQSIKQLETKLGQQLFFRKGRRIKLTNEGKMLFSHVEQAFNFIKSGERALNEMLSMLRGEIRIGASDTICKYYLLPYLKRFNEEYSDIKIHVTNKTSPKCMELLKAGSVDFAVVNLPKNIGEIFEVRKTKSVEDVFIGGSRCPELKGRQVSLKELKNYPLLVLEKNTVTREYFDDLLEENHVDIKPEVDLGSVDLLVELTRIGLGISFVPDKCVDEGAGDVFIIDLKEKISERYLGVITLKKLPLSRAASKFIDML